MIEELQKIPLELYVVSYMNKCAKEGIKAIFDEICLEVIPLLKNGVTPDDRFIKEILEEVATLNKKTGEWKLKTDDPKLFDDI